MYDNHLYCPDYGKLKNIIADIISGDDTSTDLEELAEYIHKLYLDGKLQATQYDHLLRYIQDVL